VYGDTGPEPLSERAAPRPVSPYGLDKLYTEHLGALYHALHGLETVPLRYFNVFGPRQDPSSTYSGVISIFVSRYLAGGSVTIFGDGEQTRDFVYVADVVEANVRAMFGSYAGPRPLNVGGGGATTLKSLATTIADIVGVEPRVTYAPARAGDIRHSRADISAIAEALGFRPRWTVRSGLEALIRESRAGT
jgi:UDP-glucose 4-epimerase